MSMLARNGWKVLRTHVFLCGGFAWKRRLGIVLFGFGLVFSVYVHVASQSLSICEASLAEGTLIGAASTGVIIVDFLLLIIFFARAIRVSMLC